MSLELASRLLDVAGLDDGPVADRLAVLFGERGVVDELEPGERAAAELARVAAAGRFDGVDHAAAVTVVELLAAHLGVEVAVWAPLAGRAAEDLDGTLSAVFVDLEDRLAGLPAPARSDLRRAIARHTVGHVARVDRIPGGDLAAFARAVDRAEEQAAGS